MNGTPAVDLTEHEGRCLISAAGKALATALRGERLSYPGLDDVDRRLADPGASFVTYEHRGSLVGCLGTLDKELPLIHDVCRNAVLAAFADPRTPGITAVPLDETTMKISVLSEPTPLAVSDFDELVEAVSSRKYGVILESGDRRSTLLPAVWEKVDSVEEFLDILWAKAGLPKRVFDAGTRVKRYETVEFFHPNVGALLEEHLAAI